MNCPKKKNGNQIRCTSTVKMGVCMIPGPGQSPPMPQPNPKHTEPPISLISMTLLLGLKSFSPNKGSFMTLIMYVKKIRLITTPAPRTNSREGFQSGPNAKNMIILDLLTIPATSRPAPKINPTKNTMNWSLIKYEFEVSLSKLFEPLTLSVLIGCVSLTVALAALILKYSPRKGRIMPKAMQMLDVIMWS